MSKTNYSWSGVRAGYYCPEIPQTLSKFVSGRVVNSLWLLLGGLGLGGLLLGSARVPLWASGQALPMRPEAGTLLKNAKLVVFLSPQTHAQLKSGQTVLVRSGGFHLRATLTTIEREILSPEATQDKFIRPPTTGFAWNQPKAVAIAHLDTPLPSVLSQVYSAEVELGSRRFASFLPLIGPFFGE